MKQYKIIGKISTVIGKSFSKIGKIIALISKSFPIRGGWFVACSITLVLIVMGAGSYYISKHKFIEPKSPKVVQAVEIKSGLTNKPVEIKQNDKSQVLSNMEISVYNRMHKMINTKIVAEDGKIWGEVEITPEGCNQLIKEVTQSGYYDKTTLLEFLNRWKNKNFASGVDEHNYLWNGLNGTIGKAKAIRP
ncbi:MAG TPA: DUF6241 domain-containing protein [Clostridium sp.]|uniref:DUF6241 domain-containing protein n=1 Tax=Clostridium sp. TaxID=1506 RepID=UPI002F93159C